MDNIHEFIISKLKFIHLRQLDNRKKCSFVDASGNCVEQLSFTGHCSLFLLIESRFNLEERQGHNHILLIEF